jgi:hypothetical protein
MSMSAFGRVSLSLISRQGGSRNLSPRKHFTFAGKNLI